MAHFKYQIEISSTYSGAGIKEAISQANQLEAVYRRLGGLKLPSMSGVGAASGTSQLSTMSRVIGQIQSQAARLSGTKVSIQGNASGLTPLSTKLSQVHSQASKLAATKVSPQIQISGLDNAINKLRQLATQASKPIRQQVEVHQTGQGGRSGMIGNLGTGVTMGLAYWGFGSALQSVGNIAQSGWGFNEQSQMTLVSLTQLMKNYGMNTEQAAAAGKNMYNWVWKTAAETPYLFSDLGRYTKEMMAWRFTPDESKRWLTRLGDVGSVMDWDQGQFQQTIYALGQIKTKGKLQAMEVRQLAEHGIPVWEAIAPEYGFTGPDAAKKFRQYAEDEGKDFEIPWEVVEKRVGKYLDQQYGGMAKQVGLHTLKGLESTLKDNFEQMMGTLEKPITDFAEKTIVPASIAITSGIQSWVKAGSDPITAGTGLANAFNNLANSAKSINWNQIFQGAGDSIGRAIGSFVSTADWGNITMTVGTVAIEGVANLVVGGISGFLAGLVQGPETKELKRDIASGVIEQAKGTPSGMAATDMYLNGKMNQYLPDLYDFIVREKKRIGDTSATPLEAGFITQENLNLSYDEAHGAYKVNIGTDFGDFNAGYAWANPLGNKWQPNAKFPYYSTSKYEEDITNYRPWMVSSMTTAQKGDMYKYALLGVKGEHAQEMYDYYTTGEGYQEKDAAKLAEQHRLERNAIMSEKGILNVEMKTGSFREYHGPGVGADDWLKTFTSEGGFSGTKLREQLRNEDLAKTTSTMNVKADQVNLDTQNIKDKRTSATRDAAGNIIDPKDKEGWALWQKALDESPWLRPENIFKRPESKGPETKDIFDIISAFSGFVLSPFLKVSGATPTGGNDLGTGQALADLKQTNPELFVPGGAFGPPLEAATEGLAPSEESKASMQLAIDGIVTKLGEKLKEAAENITIKKEDLDAAAQEVVKKIAEKLKNYSPTFTTTDIDNAAQAIVSKIAAKIKAAGDKVNSLSLSGSGNNGGSPTDGGSGSPTDGGTPTVPTLPPPGSHLAFSASDESARSRDINDAINRGADAQQSKTLSNPNLVTNATTSNGIGSSAAIPIYVQDAKNCDACAAVEKAVQDEGLQSRVAWKNINTDASAAAEAQSKGIGKTPTAIVNGKKIEGADNIMNAVRNQTETPTATPTAAPTSTPVQGGHKVCKDGTCTVVYNDPTEETNPWITGPSPGLSIESVSKGLVSIWDQLGSGVNSLLTPTINANTATGELSGGVNILALAAIGAVGGLGGIVGYLNAISNMKPSGGGASAGGPVRSPLGEWIYPTGGAYPTDTSGNPIIQPSSGGGDVGGGSPTLTVVPAAAAPESYYQSEAFYASGQIHKGGLIIGHGGLGPDEVSAVLQTGERVLSRGQNEDFGDVLRKLSGGTGSRRGSTIQFNPTITVNAATSDPGQIADKVKDKILEAAAKLFKQMWEQEFATTGTGAYDIRAQ